MAPQDASPMQVYSAMADVAPFLFIVFQYGELLAVFQFHDACVLGKRSSAAAFRFCFLPPHGSTAIKGAWRCKTVGDRVRTAITARSRW
jgi:hypothetical protein